METLNNPANKYQHKRKQNIMSYTRMSLDGSYAHKTKKIIKTKIIKNILCCKSNLVEIHHHHDGDYHTAY